MKHVQSSLKKWMNDNENFKERHLKIKEEVLNDPEIKEFLSHHPQLSKQEIENNLVNLYEYKTQSKQCKNCSSLHKCKNILKGYSPVLYVENNTIHLSRSEERRVGQ